MLTRARVEFKKPDIRELKRDGYSLFDMHVHTRYSDGVSKIKTILKRAKKLGIGLAITDHNEIIGNIKLSKHREISIIPGIETTTSEGIHTLFYFFKASELENFYYKYVMPNKLKNPISFLSISLPDLVDYAKESNAIICAAHPYAMFWTGICKQCHDKNISKNILNKFDAIEVISGSNTKRRNMKALELAEKLDKGIAGGSDAHTSRAIGKVVSYAKYNADVNDFLESMLKNETFVVGKEIPMVYKATSTSLKITVPSRTPFPYMKRSFSYMKEKGKNGFRNLRKRKLFANQEVKQVKKHVP